MVRLVSRASLRFAVLVLFTVPFGLAVRDGVAWSWEEKIRRMAVPSTPVEVAAMRARGAFDSMPDSEATDPSSPRLPTAFVNP